MMMQEDAPAHADMQQQGDENDEEMDVSIELVWNAKTCAGTQTIFSSLDSHN